MSSDDTALLSPSPDADPLWDSPFVRGLSRLGGGWRQVDRRRPWFVDAGLVALMIGGFCVPDLLRQHEPAERHLLLGVTDLPWPVTVALQAGLVLPLLWRRRRPTVVFSVICGVFLLSCALGVWLRASVAVLVALYSLTLHGRLRHLPAACFVAAGSLSLVAIRLHTSVSVVDSLFFLFSTVIAAVALGLVVRIRRAQLAGLRERAARLEIERDQRSQLAVATERTRVAREMHDIVGHNLSVIITLADGGAYAAELSPERGKQALLMIGDTGRQALGELRRSLGVLREQNRAAPQLSPQPGVADIGALCDRIRSAGPQVVYRSVGDLDDLDRGVQLTVYRILQEALTNALKHAGNDTRIRLAVTVEASRVYIDVHDTGPGRGPVRPGPPHDHGHGLTGMRERAALYHGTVVTGPAPGGGWTVQAMLDLTPLAGLAGLPEVGGAA